MNSESEAIIVRRTEEKVRWTLEDEWLNTNHEKFQLALQRASREIVKCEKFLREQGKTPEQYRAMLHAANTTYDIYLKLYQSESLDRFAHNIIEASPLHLVVETALNRLDEASKTHAPDIIVPNFYPHCVLAKDLGISYDDLVGVMRVAIVARTVEHTTTHCWKYKTASNKPGTIYQLTPTGKRYVLHQRALATK